MLTILWRDKESAGYTDLLPEEWFVAEGRTDGRVHLVKGKGPRTATCKAKCNIVVRGVIADLDYRPYGEFNTRQVVLLGVLRVQFVDSKRRAISQVWWKNQGSNRFGRYPTTVGQQPTGDSTKPEDIEGRQKLETHLKSERSWKLTNAKRNSVLEIKGSLACEACGFVFADLYGTLGESYCEVHHLRPLAKGGARRTRLQDLTILCSNCHRMIHRTSPMWPVQDLRRRISASRRSGQQQRGER
jgi:5-methylcytosine-specific restriction endonuclease McrA